MFIKSIVILIAAVLQVSAAYAEENEMQKFGLEEYTENVITEVEPDKITSGVVESEPKDEPTVSEDNSAATIDNSKGKREQSGLVELLQLSPEQQAKAKQIQSQSDAKMTQVLLQVEALRNKAHEIENQALEDFMAILNAEQKELFLRTIPDKKANNLTK